MNKIILLITVTFALRKCARGKVITDQQICQNGIHLLYKMSIQNSEEKKHKTLDLSDRSCNFFCNDPYGCNFFG